MSKPKENNYICGTCRHYDSDICECELHPEWGFMLEEDTCDEWADDNEPTEEDVEGDDLL